MNNITVTQALIDAQPHLDVEVNDTVIPSQLTAPVTQAMLDADASLVAAGFKVGDIIANGPSTSKTFSFSVTGTVDQTGVFFATTTGDIVGSATGVVNPDGTFNGTFSGTVPTSTSAGQSGSGQTLNKR